MRLPGFMRLRAAPLNVAVIICASACLFGQQPTLQDSLLDSLVGKWVLTGTVGNTPTTHDVEIRWVLNHQFVQIHEVSREKRAGSQAEPQYEAIVLLGWDANKKQYVVYWTDVYGGGFSVRGYAAKMTSSIPIVFKSDDGNFYNTMDYDQSAGTWRWTMDNEKNGVKEPFARLTLKRKKG
ncbi:MAG TPA: DUF1579 family protein [Candidatus Angelobacter sp.]